MWQMLVPRQKLAITIRRSIQVNEMNNHRRFRHRVLPNVGPVKTGWSWTWLPRVAVAMDGRQGRGNLARHMRLIARLFLTEQSRRWVPGAVLALDQPPP